MRRRVRGLFGIGLPSAPAGGLIVGAVREPPTRTGGPRGRPWGNHEGCPYAPRPLIHRMINVIQLIVFQLSITLTTNPPRSTIRKGAPRPWNEPKAFGVRPRSCCFSCRKRASGQAPASSLAQRRGGRRTKPVDWPAGRGSAPRYAEGLRPSGEFLRF